jgi:hypothetical protein
LDEVFGHVFLQYNPLMPRVHSTIDCKLDQTVVELHLEDQ